MFSKIGKIRMPEISLSAAARKGRRLTMSTKFFKRGEHATQEPRQRSYRSIANNLAALHILAVSLIFSIGVVFLYVTLLNHLKQSGIKELREKTALVKTMLQTANGLGLLETEMQTQAYEAENLRACFRLLDRHGRIILESPEMTALFPVSAFPQPDGSPDVLQWRVSTGELYLLKTARLPENLFNGKGGELQIGTNISEDERLIKLFRNTLLISSLGGFVFAVMSAIFIVRQGLKPLKDMSATVQQITELQLNTRINPALLPVEMESLVSSFNSMLGRLENAFSKLAQYSENLAHELRTPLNNLMIEADIALSRQRTPDEYQKVINSSLEEYGRLALLIDRLLFLARANNQQLELAIARIDVRQAFENVAEFHSESARDKGITVTVVGGAILLADPVLFCRAIDNLLANALNYTPAKGTITLAAHQAEDSSVEISVSDTGCGIDPGLLPKIFDRYFWVESTRKKDPKGAGLGLDIVKAIMELHGGSVEIQSELGKGTTLTLMFPHRPDPVREI
jgi:two-component system, OmpR family, heavy metal sensor histidine kinase CusS